MNNRGCQVVRGSHHSRFADVDSPAMLIGLVLAIALISLTACIDEPPTPTPAATATLTAMPTFTPIPAATPTPMSATPTFTPVPTATLTPTPSPTPTPVPRTLLLVHDTNNARWLVRNYPALARQIQTLSWVYDGLSDLERSALDELLWMAAEDVGNLETALRLSWVQDDIAETEYDLIDALGALDFDASDVVSQLLSMPFLLSPDTTLLEVWGGWLTKATSALSRTTPFSRMVSPTMRPR